MMPPLKAPLFLLLRPALFRGCTPGGSAKSQGGGRLKTHPRQNSRLREVQSFEEHEGDLFRILECTRRVVCRLIPRTKLSTPSYRVVASTRGMVVSLLPR